MLEEERTLLKRSRWHTFPLSHTEGCLYQNLQTSEQIAASVVYWSLGHCCHFNWEGIWRGTMLLQNESLPLRLIVQWSTRALQTSKTQGEWMLTPPLLPVSLTRHEPMAHKFLLSFNSLPLELPDPRRCQNWGVCIGHRNLKGHPWRIQGPCCGTHCINYHI